MGNDKKSENTTFVCQVVSSTKNEVNEPQGTDDSILTECIVNDKTYENYDKCNVETQASHPMLMKYNAIKPVVNYVEPDTTPTPREDDSKQE